MELVERFGGLGRIQVQRGEEGHLKRLLRCTSNEHNNALRSGNQYTEYASNKQAFLDVMEQLFPAFPVMPGSYGQFTVIDRENNSYQSVGPCQERLIGSSLFLGHARPQNVDLRLITSSSEPGYFMTIALDSSYSRSAEDDLVELLGLKESPSIHGAAPILLNKPNNWIQYGIADVPALGKVLRLYEQSQKYIEKLIERGSITRKQLDILHRDSLKHENVAICILSDGEYQKILQNLASYDERVMANT